ncbi:MAG: DNA-binding protein [Nitrosopumilus sp.]|nr:DNA-binding protein [Nitrosopumilus sp.]MCV0391907.1 DNA-binding protein [Nitrosopumilus sp.]
MSDSKKSKDAEDILSEFDSRKKSESQPEPQLDAPEPEPQLDAPEPEPQLDAPEPEPQLDAPEPEPQLDAPEPESTEESTKSQYDKAKYFSDSPHSTEERDVIFVGTKPIMTYVSATLTQLSTQPTVTIKARGKRITQAVDVSQMIVKRMDSVGYVISDVRISSDSLTSQDGKQRNVSTMEIDISKN